MTSFPCMPNSPGICSVEGADRVLIAADQAGVPACHTLHRRRTRIRSCHARIKDDCSRGCQRATWRRQADAPRTGTSPTRPPVWPEPDPLERRVNSPAATVNWLTSRTRSAVSSGSRRVARPPKSVGRLRGFTRGCSVRSTTASPGRRTARRSRKSANCKRSTACWRKR